MNNFTKLIYFPVQLICICINSILLAKLVTIQENFLLSPEGTIIPKIQGNFESVYQLQFCINQSQFFICLSITILYQSITIFNLFINYNFVSINYNFETVYRRNNGMYQLQQNTLYPKGGKSDWFTAYNKGKVFHLW